MKLSPDQKEIIKNDGPTLVVSGAGSGKTTVLTSKVASLIDKGYDSKRILAITFTNKAADEMKTRLTDMTGLPPSEFPWVRTFHSAAYRILRSHVLILGYSTPLQVYSGYQQKKLIENIIRGMGFDKEYTMPVLTHISKAKNSGNPYEYFSKNSHVSRISLPGVFNAYEAELKRKNAVDFDNMLLFTRNLLRDHKNIRDHYRELFQHILCDEYQDTNPLQAMLTDLLVKDGNLFCVGDDWQSIYHFRGSNADHFLSFQNKFRKAKIFRLEENYRSASEIVQAANALISNNSHKIEKRCFSEIRGGVVSTETFADEKAEASFVSEQITDIIDNRLMTLDKVAVLYRIRACSILFESEFSACGIPYEIVGDRSFFERKEVLDINAYILSIVYVKDDISFLRILNIPRRGIGAKKADNVREYSLRRGISLQAAAREMTEKNIFSGKSLAGMRILFELFDRAADMSPSEIISGILSIGYEKYLENYSKSPEDYVSRKENVQQLRFFSDSLTEYVSKISENIGGRHSDSDNCVQMMTIHAAKGLEFEAVFLIGCEEDMLPHWRASSPAEVEEERRLMYVGMTRARKYLIMSSARIRRQSFRTPSRFLRETISQRLDKK